jgi:hypothetical protein
METRKKPLTPFILSLIGGILILLGGVIVSLWFIFGNASFGGFGYMISGFMDRWHGMMGSYEFSTGFMTGLSLIGLVSGTIVIIGAVMLNIRPAEHALWGTVILVFSTISFVSMGGFFVGAILGIIGGAFAISWRAL